MPTTPLPRRDLASRAFVGLAWLVFLATAGPLPGESLATDAIERHEAAASAAYERAEPQEAESHYRLALLEGWTLLGELALADDDLEAAETAFAHAAASAPPRAIEARTALAAVQTTLGMPDRALDELRPVTRASPDEPAPRRELLRALAVAGLFEEARAEIGALQRVAPALAEDLEPKLAAAAEAPGDATTLFPPPTADPAYAALDEAARDEARARVEKTVAAIERRLEEIADETAFDLVRARLMAGENGSGESEPTAPLEELQRSAREDLRTSRPNEANEALRRAAELGPLDRDLAIYLAEIERRDGRIPASNHQLRSLAKRFASPAAEIALARNAAEIGARKIALDHARRALESAPVSEKILRLQAEIALDADLPEQAVRSVDALVRMHPDEGTYAELSGRLWSALGDSGAASTALLRAVELAPDQPSIRRALGLALVRDSRFEEAREHLQIYLEAMDADDGDEDDGDASEDLDALAGLAEAEERLGEGDAAAERARRVLESDAEHPRANLVLGMARSRQGRFEEAREALERAVARGVTDAKAHYQLSFACARLGDRECAEEQLALYRRATEAAEAGTLLPGGGVREMTLMRKKEPAKTEEGGENGGGR